MLSSLRVSCRRIPQRWVLTVMTALAITNAYVMRVCLSLAITEMVASSESSSNTTDSEASCPVDSDSTSSNSTSSGGTYEWDEYTQGIILSSFYWGYILTQVPGGMLADKFGGKYTLGLGICTTALFSLLTPVVTQAFGAVGLIVIRFAMGFCEGITFPAVSVLIAQWAPPPERSMITAVIMSGIALGTVVGNALSGVLIQYSSMGWPIVFYFYGAMGILWFIIWIPLCYNSPDVHPFISEGEKKYLEQNTNMLHCGDKIQPVPWRRMMTSVPVWALLIAKTGFAFGFYIILTDLPKYMSDVLHFSIETNGFLTALPHLLLWLIGTTSSLPADWLIRNNKMSRTNVRKYCHTIASAFPAVFIIAASYANCDRIAVVVLFTIAVGSMGPYYISVMINPNDLSPNYSGTLMALVNTIASATGIMAPYVVGAMTPNQTLSEWRVVFWITFAFYVVTAAIFHIWADGEVQYWDDLDSWKEQRMKVKKKQELAGEKILSPVTP